jgi:predicted acylesterase/phospholipase RssA
MKALVLSGGGLFGAWQVGAWRALQSSFEPDVIIGCSIGSLNGYVIASGASPDELADLWRQAEFRDFGRFHENLRQLTTHYSLRRPYALTVTDTLAMTPKIYRDRDVTWRHLAASCAVPLALPQIKLDGRWHTDGGLLASLPVWAAVEMGATEILGLNVLKVFPSAVMAPFVRGFKWAFGPRPVLPSEVRVTELFPSERLGGLRDTFLGSGELIERWIELGAKDAAGAQKHFP